MIYKFFNDARDKAQWTKGLCLARSYFVPFSNKELCAASSSDKEVTSSDRVFSLSGSWDFYLDDGTASSVDTDTLSWSTTVVPSYWKVDDGDSSPYLLGRKVRKPVSRGIYRTRFSVYDEKATHFVSFTRVGGAFDVYLNGVFCGRSMTGEGEFDLSSFVRSGDNELLVVVSAFSPADVFFCGAANYHGIIGDVLLSVHPAASLVDYSFETVFDSVAYIGRLSLAFIAKEEFSTKITLCDGEKVLETREPSGKEQTVEFRDLYRAYTPEDPYLYDVYVQIFVGGKEVECTRLKVGFFDRKTKNGLTYCEHPFKIMAADYRGIVTKEGKLMTREDHIRDLELLKKCRLNAVRLVAPVEPEFIRLCSEKGVMVIDGFGFDLSRLPEKGEKEREKFFESQSATDFVKEVCLTRAMRDRSAPALVGFAFPDKCDKKCFSDVASAIVLPKSFMLYGGEADGCVRSVVTSSVSAGVAAIKNENGVFFTFPSDISGSSLASMFKLAEKNPGVFGCAIKEFRDFAFGGKTVARGLFDENDAPSDGGVFCKYYLRPLRSVLRENRFLDVFNTSYFAPSSGYITILLRFNETQTVLRRFAVEIGPREIRSYNLPALEGENGKKLEICYRDADGNHISSELIPLSKEPSLDAAVEELHCLNYAYSLRPFDTVAEENTVSPRARFTPASRMAACDTADGKTDRVFSLCGEWDFRYLGKNPVPASFTSSEGEWNSIPVPGTWEEAGYEKFAFSHGYAFPCKKEKKKISLDKKVENTAAIYKKVINVADLSYRYYLYFESLSGAVQVYLNGQYVGCSSYRTAEFELSDYLTAGENELVVVMRKWSKNSLIYAENNFLATGFIGEVSLIKSPKKGLVDCAVSAQKIGKTFFADVKATFGEEGGKAVVCIKQNGAVLATEEREITEKEISFRLSGDWKPYFEESPTLYDVYLSVIDREKEVECTKIKTGLFTLVRDNGVLYYNGVPLKVRAVVYNPVYSSAKRLMTLPEYKRDLALIKKYGFNAVQPSFVPGAAFLDACRAAGVYVVCPVPVREAYPVCDKKHRFGVFFEPDFIERVTKQAEIEYKRTSLFNNVIGYATIQTGDYPALTAAVDRLKELGAPIVIGPSGSVCGMVYPSVDKVMEKVGEAMGKEVLYLTEYAPSFGVGCPDATGYEDIIASSPCCLGGAMVRFTDEFIGGEGGRDDGLFTVDRMPTTGAENIKYLYRKVRSKLLSDKQLEISNLFDYKDTSDYLIKLCIVRDGHVLSRTDLTATVPARGSRVFDVFIDHIGGDMFLNVEFLDKRSGELLYTEQHRLSEKMQTFSLSGGDKLRVDEFPDYLDIYFNGGAMRFDKKLGAFTRYAVRNKEVLKADRLVEGGNCFVSNIERPFVRNVLKADRPHWTQSLRDFSWQRGEDGTFADILVETSVNRKGKECFVIRDKYIVSSTGKIEVFSVINTMRRNLPNLDCFGKQLRLHNAFGNVSYYGLGAGSTYVDMCGGAVMGLHTLCVDRTFDGVQVKQECGNRMDVHYAIARDKDGDGIMCIAEKTPFQLRVSPLGDKEIERACRGEKVAQSGVYIDVNAFVGGFGSNRGEPAKKYTYMPVEYVLHFSVLPVAGDK